MYAIVIPITTPAIMTSVVAVAPASSSSTSFRLPFLRSLAANCRYWTKTRHSGIGHDIDGARAIGCAKRGLMVSIRRHQCPWCSHVGNTMVVGGWGWKYLAYGSLRLNPMRNPFLSPKHTPQQTPNNNLLHWRWPKTLNMTPGRKQIDPVNIGLFGRPLVLDN
jgi:hypothetical protein